MQSQCKANVQQARARLYKLYQTQRLVVDDLPHTRRINSIPNTPTCQGQTGPGGGPVIFAGFPGLFVTTAQSDWRYGQLGLVQHRTRVWVQPMRQITSVGLAAEL